MVGLLRRRSTNRFWPQTLSKRIPGNSFMCRASSTPFALRLALLCSLEVSLLPERRIPEVVEPPAGENPSGAR